MEGKISGSDCGSLFDSEVNVYLNNNEVGADFWGDDVYMVNDCRLQFNDSRAAISISKDFRHVHGKSRWKRLLRGPGAVSENSMLDLGKRKISVLDYGPPEHYGHDSGGLKKSKLNVITSDSVLFSLSSTEVQELDNATVSFISTTANKLVDREP